MDFLKEGKLNFYYWNYSRGTSPCRGGVPLRFFKIIFGTVGSSVASQFLAHRWRKSSMPRHSNKVQPVSYHGSTLTKAWVLVKDPLVGLWGVMPRQFYPKHSPIGVRFIPTDFRVMKTHKNTYNKQGHTSHTQY